MRQLWPKASYQIGYGGTTSYGGVADGDIEWALSITFGADHAKMPLARDSVVRDLVVYTREVFPAAVTVSLLVNGVASGLAVTLPAGAITAAAAGPEVSVLAGQDVCYRYEGPLIPLPGASVACCLERIGEAMLFGVCPQPSDGVVGQGWIGGAFGNGVFEPYNAASPPATSRTYSLCAVPGTLTGLCLRTYSGAPGASAWTAWIVKNGVRQDGTGGTVDTTTVLTGTATVVIQPMAVPGTYYDRFEVVVVRSGVDAGFASAHVAAGIAYTPTVDGQFMLCGGSSDAIAALTTSWKWTRSQQASGSVPVSLLELAHLAPIGSSGLATVGLYVERSVAPGAGTSAVHTLRRTEANTALVATVTGAATTASGTAAEPYGSGDTITLQIAPVGTPISADLHWGVGAVVGTVTAPSTHLGIRRLRRAPHLSAEQGEQFFARFQLDLEAGVGNATDPGLDPQVWLRWSDDGGHTWRGPLAVSAGLQGQFRRRALWRRLGRSRDRVFEVSMRDPVKWALLAASLDASKGSS